MAGIRDLFHGLVDLLSLDFKKKNVGRSRDPRLPELNTLDDWRINEPNDTWQVRTLVGNLLGDKNEFVIPLPAPMETTDGDIMVRTLQGQTLLIGNPHKGYTIRELLVNASVLPNEEHRKPTLGLNAAFA